MPNLLAAGLVPLATAWKYGGLYPALRGTSYKELEIIGRNIPKEFESLCRFVPHQKTPMAMTQA
jgi:hypothetical protein